jgi:16S rRNA (guanine527-N7)-methyltransferase
MFHVEHGNCWNDLSRCWSRKLRAKTLSPLPPCRTSGRATSPIRHNFCAGFPGIIVAVLSDHAVTLAESRTKRVQFLRAVIDSLALSGKAEVQGSRVETMAEAKFDIISARAFAPLDRLFALAMRFSREETTWLLPKGRNAITELEAARASWQGDFRIEPSLTDPDAAILVAHAVRPKGRR